MASLSGPARRWRASQAPLAAGEPLRPRAPLASLSGPARRWRASQAPLAAGEPLRPRSPLASLSGPAQALPVARREAERVSSRLAGSSPQ
jgi:hypothetical protein